MTVTAIVQRLAVLGAESATDRVATAREVLMRSQRLGPRPGARRRPDRPAVTSRPISRRGLDLQKNYMANVSTVGQDETPSP
jgi:hypothetical protein